MCRHYLHATYPNMPEVSCET